MNLQNEFGSGKRSMVGPLQIKLRDLGLLVIGLENVSPLISSEVIRPVFYLVKVESSQSSNSFKIMWVVIKAFVRFHEKWIITFGQALAKSSPLSLVAIERQMQIGH